MKMDQRIINLTLLLVMQEIEEILSDYPENPDQLMLASQQGQNKLINHVLSQIPNHYYTLLEDGEELPTDVRSLYSSVGERMQLEVIIHKSIFQIRQEHLTEIKGCLFQEANNQWIF